MTADGTQDTHRVCRGRLPCDSARQPGLGICADERDRKLWLATLGEACEKTGWRIHAWLMTNNHYEARKGAWGKEVLAWWLCQHTTARRRWVSERLGMGDESRVTQAIGLLKRKGQPELERLKRRLAQVYENHNGEVEV